MAAAVAGAQGRNGQKLPPPTVRHMDAQPHAAAQPYGTPPVVTGGQERVAVREPAQRAGLAGQAQAGEQLPARQLPPGACSVCIGACVFEGGACAKALACVCGVGRGRTRA